jgi:hypothetical protein
MALDNSILKQELEKIFDNESDLFEGFPETHELAAERWATAFDTYAKAVVPPSLTSEVAKAAFVSTFLGMNFSNGVIQFPLCFVNYAAALAPGMAPLNTGVPPIGIPIFAPIYAIGYGGGSSAACIALLVNILDTWIKTGTATLVAPPNTVVNWS